MKNRILLFILIIVTIFLHIYNDWAIQNQNLQQNQPYVVNTNLNPHAQKGINNTKCGWLPTDQFTKCNYVVTDSYSQCIAWDSTCVSDETTSGKAENCISYLLKLLVHIFHFWSPLLNQRDKILQALDYSDIKGSEVPFCQNEDFRNKEMSVIALEKEDVIPIYTNSPAEMAMAISIVKHVFGIHLLKNVLLSLLEDLLKKKRLYKQLCVNMDCPTINSYTSM